MVEVKKYYFPPTPLIPNSPQPLLHYPGLLKTPAERRPAEINRRFNENDWLTQWIFRYGPTQHSHYHSGIHECMAVLSGSATIRFGVADTSDDMERNTYGDGKEEGGIELQVQAGDVFVIPAGVAHKTFNTSPGTPFALLTPGEGHGIQVPDINKALENVQVTGFTMMGAYPKNCGTWDFALGGDDVGDYERTWGVAKPDKDPVLGTANEGVCGQWSIIPLSKRKDPIAKL